MSGDGPVNTGNPSGNTIGEAFGEDGSSLGEALGEGRWLTYSELAEIRGIGRESAVKLVQRERWRRQPGNARTVRVYVPADWLKPAARGDRIGEAATADFREVAAIFGETSPKFRELASLMSALQDAVSFVREQEKATKARADQAEAGRRAADARADAERTRADQAEADRRGADARADHERVRASQAEARTDAERARADLADQALGAERARADALQDRLTAAQAETQTAQAAAEAALQAAEALRQGAEARADRAEQGRDGERARADAMHDRFEALLNQLSGVDGAEAVRQAGVMVSGLLEAHAGEVNALKEERDRLAAQLGGFALRGDQAEARAKQAEVRIDQAEARTDSLRARVDVLQRERDTARAEATQAAETLRQAEAARKARGLLARLRTAWRGR